LKISKLKTKLVLSIMRTSYVDNFFFYSGFYFYAFDDLGAERYRRV